MKTILIAVTTLCGRISPATFGSPEDRRHLEKMREETDASILGAGSLMAGDPEMRGPSGIHLPGRTRALITMSGDIPIEGKRLFQSGPKPVIFTQASKKRKLEMRAGDKADIIAVKNGRFGLSIKEILTVLEKRGAEKVLIEGGGRLNYACLAEGVVDEVVVTVAPFISGDRHAATLADSPDNDPENRPDSESGIPGDFISKLKLIDMKTGNTGEIFTRYRVIRKEEIQLHPI